MNHNAEHPPIYSDRSKRIAAMIETRVNNPDMTMRQLGAMFLFRENTVCELIGIHWLYKKPHRPVTIVLQSKMNDQEKAVAA